MISRTVDQGESERYIKQLFALAKKSAPSVIFFDELDSIGCARGSAGDDVQHRRLLAELLIQFNFVSAEHKLIVLAATNRIEDVDEALLRRFHARICVGPPAHASRIALLKSFMATVKHDLSIKQFDAIADATEGWSGADIEALCREAALAPVRTLLSASPSWRKVVKYNSAQAIAPINSETDSVEVMSRTKKLVPTKADVEVKQKRPATEVTPPRESNMMPTEDLDTATCKRPRLVAMQLDKDLVEEHQGAPNEEDDFGEGEHAMAFALEEMLREDDSSSFWEVPSVTYKDFLAAYATMLSVDVPPQELQDLVAVHNN